MTRGRWIGGWIVGAIGDASFGSFDDDGLGGSLGALPPLLLPDVAAPWTGRGCALLPGGEAVLAAEAPASSINAPALSAGADDGVAPVGLPGRGAPAGSVRVGNR
ncbi:hypothetical protein D9M72_599530 [compost metagenome]